jgi:hypothetical protein
MGQFFRERTAQLSCSADQAWEYMSDVRRAMTLDQFHMSVDCDPTDAVNPKPGLTIPILHRILGFDHVRLARITKYSDYQIAWGESTPQGEADAYPHSEGWRFDEIDSKSCEVTLWMKGEFRTPIGSKIQDSLWEKVIGPALDLDIADLGQACGAAMSRPAQALTAESGQLLSLAFAQEIDGVSPQEFFDRTPPLCADKTGVPTTWKWAGSPWA